MIAFDPVQDHQNISPDLGLINLFDTLIVFFREYFLKNILKKIGRQPKHEKLPKNCCHLKTFVGTLRVIIRTAVRYIVIFKIVTKGLFSKFRHKNNYKQKIKLLF